MTFITGYAEWLTAFDYSPRTIRQRVAFAAARQQEWGSLDQPASTVVAWLRQYEGWTRSTYLNHLRSVYAYMAETGLLTNPSPLARIRPTPKPESRSTPLSLEERRRVFDTATGDLLAWISLAYYAGLRNHEITKFRGRDLDQLHVRVVGKGRTTATLPTHPNLWRLAQDYPDDGLWFPSTKAGVEHIAESNLGRHIRAHFADCEIPRGSVHRLRHTYANELRRAGVDMRIIQILLRHKSLATTQAYFAVDDTELLAGILTLGA